MKKLHSLANRALALIMSVLMVVGMLPTGAVATGTGDDASLGYGNVTAITSGAAVSGSQTANTTVTFDQPVTVNWHAKDPSIGRYQDGWWIGTKITVPAGMTEEQVKNAKYMSGGVEKEFWNGKDSAEGAAEHYMTMWIPMNGLLTGDLTPYVYKFDWDNDTVYEQTLTISVDKTKVTLVKDGAQVYPALGQVSSYNGGTVTGSGTGDVTVMVDNAALTWSPADTTIGRYQDGWWVGIKVQAPTDLPAEVLKNAKYQAKGDPSVTWDQVTDVRSFWSNKDSADTDTTHYIQMWFPISAETVENFKNAGRNITMWYRFNWDNNDTYEQNITFSVDPNGTIVFNKASQTGFAFADPTPSDVWVGSGTFENAAGGGQTDGAVTYAITDGDAATIDPATGKLTFTKTGSVTVKATKAGDSHYKEATATYTVTAVKNDQTPSFTSSAPSDLIYADGLTWENPVVNAQGNVTYAIIGEVVNGTGVATIDPATGKLTIAKAGTVTVQAEIAGNEQYNSKTITYTLVINKAEQTEFGFDNPPASVTWQSDALDALALKGALGEGAVSYAITSGTDVAEVAADGKTTLLKAGSFTIQAQKAGDERYNASDAVSTTVTVDPRAQTGFDFPKETVTVTYNDNGNKYTQKPTGGQSSGDITYSIVSGDAVELNSATGEVKLLKAGEAVIKATKAGDTKYQSATATYTLKILQAGQKFIFEKGESVEVRYGTLEYENPVVFAGEHGNAAVTYSISANDIGASVNADGKITFASSVGKVGTVTVTAKIAADDQYKEATASYTLKVGYLTTDAKPVAIGTQADAASGWFTGDVVIKAPTNYTISTDNALDATWSEQVPFVAEGADQTAEVYLKNADGHITDVIQVTGINTDAVDPSLTVTYIAPTWQVMLESVTFGLYQVETLQVSISSEDENSGIASLVYSIGGEDVKLAFNGDKTVSHSVTINAQHSGRVTCTAQDVSGRTATFTGGDIVVLDTQKPVFQAEYTYDRGKHQDLDGISYTQGNTTVDVTIDEANFKLSGLDIIGTEEKTGLPVVKVNGEGKSLAWKQEGTTTAWKDSFTLSGDGHYQITADYTDPASNVMDSYTKELCIDGTAPTDLVITYSQAESEKILQSLTLGFYQPKLTVTVSAKDITAGIEYFTWSYSVQEDASAVNKSYSGELKELTVTDGTATATFQIPEPARGSVTVIAVDKAGNSAKLEDTARVNVVDGTAPVVNVTYESAKAGNPVNTDSIYFNDNVNAKITVEEANFFEGVSAADGIISQVGIKVTRTDDNGDQTVTEYLPADAQQKYAGAKAETITWSTNGDTHTAVIPYNLEGDYVLEMTYSDLSGNAAQITGSDGVAGSENYTSKTITVDKKAPVVSVQYGNTNVVNTIDGRRYFTTAQSAVITVTEHNFRAADVAAAVKAVSYQGKNVSVADFAAQLAKDSSWTHNGNVHTAKVSFPVEANYTFDIAVKDLALNQSKDYAEDLFTVDGTDPQILKISYSTNVFQEILKSVTFGYYDAPVTVTITAQDETAGIHHFAYSYTKAANVSDVNAQLLDQAIKAANIRYENGKAIATFQIPQKALNKNNQFNGTVTVVAYDRCENDTQKKDNTRIIVDNITPTASVTYNAPAHTENKISYYDGNINASVVIREANFDSGDVDVTVTKDGSSYPVKVSWKNNSVDVHTGSFQLTEDGDYTVSIRYADKSGNKMEEYTSNQLTLDATAPSIQVSNIKANSANKDETYGFRLQISDTNLNVATMKPVLEVVKSSNGVYETVQIDLGEPTAVTEGKTYTYTVENLPDDGLYTLTCKAADMAGNTFSKILLEDGKTYEQVQFSINRAGSAFGYGNDYTKDLVEQYYVYNVDGDVVVVEVNVDPIENYALSLNGKTLTEGTDFTTSQTSNPGEWSKRIYTLNNDLFAEEGEYNVIVSSTDKATTAAYSDVKGLTLAFVVDRTAPELTITGLEAGGRYQTDAQTVTLIPTDEGGRLNSLSVVVLDADGKPLTDDKGTDISVRFTMSGEELLKHLEANDGKIVFTIPEGLNNRVQILCSDCAMDTEQQANEYVQQFERVTVSQNQLIIFYANTPLFIGTIVGILALILLIIILIKRKKNKK